MDGTGVPDFVDEPFMEREAVPVLGPVAVEQAIQTRGGSAAATENTPTRGVLQAIVNAAPVVGLVGVGYAHR